MNNPRNYRAVTKNEFDRFVGYKEKIMKRDSDDVRLKPPGEAFIWWVNHYYEPSGRC